MKNKNKKGSIFIGVTDTSNLKEVYGNKFDLEAWLNAEKVIYKSFLWQ